MQVLDVQLNATLEYLDSFYDNLRNLTKLRSLTLAGISESETTEKLIPILEEAELLNFLDLGISSTVFIQDLEHLAVTLRSLSSRLKSLRITIFTREEETPVEYYFTCFMDNFCFSSYDEFSLQNLKITFGRISSALEMDGVVIFKKSWFKYLREIDELSIVCYHMAVEGDLLYNVMNRVQSTSARTSINIVLGNCNVYITDANEKNLSRLNSLNEMNATNVRIDIFKR